MNTQQQLARHAFESRWRNRSRIAAICNQMQAAANDLWYERGCYERYGRDYYGVTYVLVSSEADDRAFETEADYRHSRGEWREVQS